MPKVKQLLPYPVYSRKEARARLLSAGYNDKDIKEVATYCKDYSAAPDPRTKLYKLIDALDTAGYTDIAYITGPMVSHKWPRSGRIFLVAGRPPGAERYEQQQLQIS